VGNFSKIFFGNRGGLLFIPKISGKNLFVTSCAHIKGHHRGGYKRVYGGRGT